MKESKDYTSFTLNQWVDHIQQQHWRTMEMTLDRITEVWARLNGKTSGLVIVVGGTNGKGSTISMLEAAFRHVGVVTGSYTSPHLVRFNERIKIASNEVSDTEICDAFKFIEDARADISLTYFEYGTLCALKIFQENKVGVSILEVGMGGRLDAVNMIDGDLSIITSVGIDHEQWLGTDRENIAIEKSGIMRPFKPVISSEANSPKNIQIEAKKHRAVLLQAERDFSITESENFLKWQGIHPLLVENSAIQTVSASPIGGEHQKFNLSGTISTLVVARSLFEFDLDAAIAGIEHAQITARCQILGYSPLQIIDVAHNADSATELGQFLRENSCGGSTYAVFGVLEDKTLQPILDPLYDQIDHWFLASLNGERGQSSEGLAEKLQDYNENSNLQCFSSPVEGYLSALSQAKSSDRVVIFGSFYTVGDIIGHLQI